MHASLSSKEHVYIKVGFLCSAYIYKSHGKIVNWKMSPLIFCDWSDTLFCLFWAISRGPGRQHESPAVTSRGAVESVSWGRNSDNRKSTRKQKLLNWPTAPVWRPDGGINIRNLSVTQSKVYFWCFKLVQNSDMASLFKKKTVDGKFASC